MFELFQMKHCCVEDPSDLCSVNISGKEISDVKEEDLALFDNVAYVNASENFLSFGKYIQNSTLIFFYPLIESCLYDTTRFNIH